MKNKLIYFAGASVMLGALLVSGTALAATNNQSGSEGFGGWGMRGNRAPSVVGTVSSVNSTTLTVTDSRTNTTYTVDASNATVTKNGSASSLLNVSVGDTVMIQGTVNGTSVTATSIRDGINGMMGRMPGRNPGIFGTVVSVNGTTLTVTSKTSPKNTTITTYIVDASSATVTKNGASSSVANIAVGDSVMVQGTVSGSSVTATSISDGMPQRRASLQNANPIINGNGQPVVGGTVASINGSALTITNKGNITYTIDASSATIEKGGAKSTLSSVAVGDNVLVQGTVNGTSVTASSVIDQGAPRTSTNGAANVSHGIGGAVSGFFGNVRGAVGGFLQHVFGFF